MFCTSEVLNIDFQQKLMILVTLNCTAAFTLKFRNSINEERFHLFSSEMSAFLIFLFVFEVLTWYSFQISLLTSSGSFSIDAVLPHHTRERTKIFLPWLVLQHWQTQNSFFCLPEKFTTYYSSKHARVHLGSRFI